MKFGRNPADFLNASTKALLVADGCAADRDDDVARSREALADVGFGVAADAEVDGVSAPATDEAEEGGLDRVDDLA